MSKIFVDPKQNLMFLHFDYFFFHFATASIHLMSLQVFRKFRLGDKADVPNTAPLPVVSHPCECRYAGLGLGCWQGTRRQTPQRGQSFRQEFGREDLNTFECNRTIFFS